MKWVEKASASAVQMSEWKESEVDGRERRLEGAE